MFQQIENDQGVGAIERKQSGVPAFHKIIENSERRISKLTLEMKRLHSVMTYGGAGIDYRQFDKIHSELLFELMFVRDSLVAFNTRRINRVLRAND